ncbi:pimeloyl-ACP methyl ester carboxylesterase [Sphingopyxis sp. OAS728]|uniref:alpha/beta fold hydrolase n=1 Tax=Sphingopyxis sp. OAS728 TaxID=2663823 RepID=UPI0017894420|nr:alpha/beta hydrolase [Sphingopyxis sp. OAS728]MBE1529930.1 pimeloyl-ACP methyl ester carboxylesterase [Sphingopyxis sp. OAS728]
MDVIPLIEPPVQSIILADGRQLTWQEFGVPEGRPVLYFHGGGSFSPEAGIFHREAVANNIRLISTNRPGAGGSSLCPGRPAGAYSHDLAELLAHLKIDKFACFGESNGGMMTLAIAAAMSDRVIGAVPINPTVPWFDPMARRVTAGSVAIAYRLMRYAPWLLASLAETASGRVRKMKTEPRPGKSRFDALNLMGPPPGTEQDIGDILWYVTECKNKPALLAELKWAAHDWGVDYHSIPVRLDFYCGVHDAQAPFALVLADENPDAQFHYFRFGHHGYCHPDARARIVGTVAGYFNRGTA